MSKIQRSQFVAPVMDDYESDSIIPSTDHWPKSMNEFNELLDEIRPKKEELELSYSEIENDGLMFTLSVKGKPRHCGVDFTHNKKLNLENEVKSIMDKYDEIHHLWPGCRGDMAIVLNAPFNDTFHQWFDQYANVGNKLNKLKFLVEKIKQLEEMDYFSTTNEQNFIGTLEPDSENYPREIYSLIQEIESSIHDIFIYKIYIDHNMRNKFKEIYGYKLTIGQKDRDGVFSLFLYTSKGKIEIEVDQEQ